MKNNSKVIARSVGQGYTESMNTADTTEGEYGEPWVVCTPRSQDAIDHEQLEIMDADENTVLFFHRDMDDDGRYTRLRACVNACSGMSDPATEIARLKEIAEAAKALKASPSFESCGQIIISTINPAWQRVEHALTSYFKEATDGKAEDR